MLPPSGQPKAGKHDDTYLNLRRVIKAIPAILLKTQERDLGSAIGRIWNHTLALNQDAVREFVVSKLQTSPY